MFKTFTLTNYRGFREFELTGLGRVNLLVGLNNSGKTSVLEAVGLLASGGDLSKLWSTMTSRGEWLVHEQGSARGRDSGVAIPYLFHGYQLEIGSAIQLGAERHGGGATSMRLEIKELSEEWGLRRSQQTLLLEGPDDEREDELQLFRGGLELLIDGRVIHRIPLSNNWALAGVLLSETRRARVDGRGERPVHIITTAAMAPDELVEIVDAIQLTEEEGHVLRALQIIEPRISHFRPTRTRPLSLQRARYEPSKRGVILKLEGQDMVLPIGTLGDGAWRILGLALALAAARGGVLLVDEIDTGLHYSVMENMWRMIIDTAARLDVQVFATSHSRDCYESLAAIADPEGPEDRRITIQRIEPELRKAVMFTEQDIINAAARGIEVR